MIRAQSNPILNYGKVAYMMKKFDLRKIMLKAWEIFRKFADLSFAECLHRAWLSAKVAEFNEKRIQAAKMAAVNSCPFSMRFLPKICPRLHGQR